jgi:hypothetical protein
MKKVAFIFLFMLLLGDAGTLWAQCSMCRRTAETSYQNENNITVKRGKSLNKGILYLLSVPYLVGAVGVFMWYKNRKKD